MAPLANRCFTVTGQSDQAAGLRALMQPVLPKIRVVAAAHDMPASQESFLQLAIAAAHAGHDLLLLDPTPGEWAIALNLRARYELLHLLQGEKRFDEIVQTPHDLPRLRYVPAHRGLQTLIDAPNRIQNLTQGLTQLTYPPDFISVYGGPALISLLAKLAISGGEMIWQVIPRSEVITATYKQLKFVARHYPKMRHLIWLHGVADRAAAELIFANLAQTAQRFLKIDLHYLSFTTLQETKTEPDFLHPEARMHYLANLIFQHSINEGKRADEVFPQLSNA